MQHSVLYRCRGLRAHPHVVTLHDIFLTRNFLVMSMEMAHGTLKGLLDMARRRGVARLEVDHARFFFQQIMLTVKYCHEKVLSPHALDSSRDTGVNR